MYLKTITIATSIAVVVSLQGCMLAGRMTKTVSRHYAREDVFSPPPSKYISVVNTDKLQKVNGFCKTEYKRFFFVPLLIYNLSSEKIKCTVNPKVFTNYIVGKIDSALVAEGLAGTLETKSLEIHFNAVPTTFFHRYNYHLFYIFTFYFGFVKEEMYNYKESEATLPISFDYLLRDRETSSIIKQGEISRYSTFNKMNRDFGTRKYLLREYVEKYDMDMKSVSDAAVNSIIEEIKNLNSL
jgi:hypothetical protein